MDNGKLSDILMRGAEQLGIVLPTGSPAAFEMYRAFLEKQGEHVNLTAITGAADIARLHFLDSIALLRPVKFTGASVIDVGSGAGFPGIPLKLAEPSIDLTLLDATSKRIAFLSELCDLLGMKAKCIHARAESASHEPDMRERYDVVVSRAVAQLNILCELCLPYIRVGGVFLALKGIESGDEVSASQKAMEILGANLKEYYDYTIPGTDIIHRVIIIEKKERTPSSYPRRFPRILRSPL